RRWRDGVADQPGFGGGGQRQRAAARVIPCEPNVAERSGRERQIELPQMFLWKIEQRPFGNEERPAGAVAAAFDLDALQERRPQTGDAKSIDLVRLPEVRLESGGLYFVVLNRRDRKDLRRPPFGVSRRRLHQPIP